jgi:single-stranded DNA-binding protein
VADEVLLLGGRGEGESSSLGTGGGGVARGRAAAGPVGDAAVEDDIDPMKISDDDVPF